MCIYFCDQAKPTQVSIARIVGASPRGVDAGRYGGVENESSLTRSVVFRSAGAVEIVTTSAAPLVRPVERLVAVRVAVRSRFLTLRGYKAMKQYKDL